MKLRTTIASAAAGALALGSTAAIAQTERSTAPASQASTMSNDDTAAPWPLLIVGVAALAALIYLLVDDDEDAISV